MSHKITHREYGHGPLLILLHGYGGTVMQWDPVVEALKDRFRVVVPNLGHLYMTSNRLLFSVQVELVAEFIKSHYPGEKVSVAGMSFGGALAWGLAVQHPQLLNKMILVNPMMPHPVNHFRLPETRYFFVLPMNDKAIARLLPTPIGYAFLRRAVDIFRPHKNSSHRDYSELKGRKLDFLSSLISHFSWIMRNENWFFWQNSLVRCSIDTGLLISKEDLLFSAEAYRQLGQDLNAHRVVEIDTESHIPSLSHPHEIVDLILQMTAGAPAEKPKQSA